MARLPVPGSKTQRRWIKGLWVGRLERDDTQIILTEAGAMSVRSVRRLPPEAQKQVSLMATATGLPWQPRWGRRVRLSPPQTSQIVVLPSPPVPEAYSPEEDAVPGPPPSLAEDGPERRVDLDALEVQGAELAEGIVAEDPLYASDDSPAEMPEPPARAEASAAADASPTAVRGAGWSSPMASLPSRPPAPTGLGEGGMSPKRTPDTAGGAAEASRPPKQAKSEPSKKAKLGKVHASHDLQRVWEAVEQWANATDADNPFAQQRLATVCDWLDGVLDPEQVRQAREAQLAKLWSRNAFSPVRKHEIPAGSQIFHYKWVDKAKEGNYKSRFTCADIKRKYSEAEEQDLRVFVPTPTPESHAVLEVSALLKGHAMRTFDIVAAFLIGQDRGAQTGEYVYMRPPPEWKPIFEEWVREHPPNMQAAMLAAFNDYYFRLDGNLYGRRTAGSVYRDEFEEILCQRLSPEFSFKRGVRDPCVYRCEKTQITLVHHVDDVRCAGPTAALTKLIEEAIPKHCEIQAGPLESEGVAVEVLGRVKTRVEGAVLTAPDPKHCKNILAALEIKPNEKSPVPSRKLDLSKDELLDVGRAQRYRSAVGSAIYLSADRRDIAYSTKELARRMAQPCECDWEAAMVLGKYLNSHKDYIRVTTLDAEADPDNLTMEVFADSDWGGCPETRRSTDSHVAYLGGAVIIATTQTQPGLPATSSPDAELRGISRAAREAIFLHGLATEDFGLNVQIPRLWSDSSTAIVAAKRIGPGSKLRHLDVCEFYVQGAASQSQRDRESGELLDEASKRRP